MAKREVLLALGWYDHELVAGIAEYAKAAGWVLSGVMGHRGGHLPSNWHGDGVLTRITEPRGELAYLIDRMRVPVVDLGGEATDLRVAWALPDDQAIGRLGAEHFLERGFADLAFLSVGDTRAEHHRMSGFHAAVAAAGKRFHHLDFMQQPRSRSLDHDLVPWLREELSALPKPLAVMGWYDGHALPVMRACAEMDVAVPEQVAVLGVDNHRIACELGPVPLSSVDRDKPTQGYEAAALLDRMMQGEAEPGAAVHVPPTGVVTRRSSDILAIQHPDVAKALRYVRDHFRKPIGVEDIVAVTDTSRRTLYELFRRHLGRTIRDELVRLRVRETRRLLTDTDQKLLAIAQQTGFRDGQHLTRVFTQATGESPTAYRKRHHAERAQHRDPA